VSELPPVDGSWVGQALLRKEDLRLIRGQGCYIDDVRLPGMVHLQIVRSPHPHARIVGFDVERARKMPGVLAVITGEDLREHVNPFPHPARLPFLKPLSYQPLAISRVRFEGEPVVAVVATDPGRAEDAAEAVEVEYEPLPAVATRAAAVAEDAPLLYEEWGDNVYCRRTASFGDVEGAFAAAEHVIDETFYMQRQAPLPIELRGTVAAWDGTDFTIYSSTQTPHLLRTLLAQVLRFPESRLRVIAPDVGGGFGVKYQLHREEALVPAIARLIGRPVKWRESIWEHLSAATHARDKEVRLRTAVANDGTILALRADMLIDVGSAMAYPSSYGSSLVLAGGLPLGLKTQNYAYDYRCVVTNKAPSGAYRGFGNNMRVFVVERTMDLVASRLGMDRLEVRRRNLVSAEDVPYRSATGVRIRSGNLIDPLEKALEEAGYASFPERQARARAEGRLLGMGFVAFGETAAPSYYGMIGAFGGGDSCTVRIEPDGSVTALVGVAPQGQGHETAFAQVIADELHVHPDDVRVRHSDTAMAPYGLGAWGSRSAVVAGGATMLACEKVRTKVLRIAAHLSGVSPEGLCLTSGGVLDPGTGKLVSLADIVNAAYGGRSHLPVDMEAGLEATAAYEPESIDRKADAEGRAMRHGTVSTQAQVATVEIDRATGQLEVLDYVVVHDCGVIINPAIVDGQIRGAVVQGLAGALYEEIVYDEAGYLSTSSLLDYQVPTARELAPRIRIWHTESPDPTVPGGFKGMAEGGTIGAPAAVANAVADALGPIGERVRATPLTPPVIAEFVLALERSERPGSDDGQREKKESM
jgi:carbon-monoxide dehydrogenase large subunit